MISTVVFSLSVLFCVFESQMKFHLFSLTSFVCTAPSHLCSFVGSTKARCQELINGFTSEIHKRMTLMLCSEHVRVFSLLLSLERMKLRKQVTETDLGLFVNGVDTSGLENVIKLDDKPSWMSNKVRNFVSCGEFAFVLVSDVQHVKIVLVVFRRGWIVLQSKVSCSLSNICGDTF